MFRTSRKVAVVLAWAALAAARPAPAQDPPTAHTLTARVALVGTPSGGEVGCALFADAAGFPLDASRARVTWQPAAAAVTCRFEALPPGRYALAVSHDVNGNRRTDRSFIGLPKEAWGVSNGVRPAMRAPRFAEAAVTVAGDTEISIEVRK
jgi:uncharacterized protein (DUF2141 family)